MDIFSTGRSGPVADSLPPVKTGLPALLRQRLADYAATGLPPAYLPKDEIEEPDYD